MRKIILVDDEAIIALNTSRILRHHGIEAVTVYSGRQALSKIEGDPEISLVLMDIDLGRGTDGIDIAGRILEVRRMPIVFLTNHADEMSIREAKAVSPYGYVLKSSGEFVLVEAIAMAFQLFEAYQAVEIYGCELRERNRVLNFYGVKAVPAR